MAKMTTGMRMLVMTKAAGNGGNRMEGNGGMQMGGYGQMGDMPEMRRRRDKRGRYMEGDDGPQMNTYSEGENRGNEMRERYYPDGMPPISPGMRSNDRRAYGGMEGAGGNRSEYGGMEMRRGRGGNRGNQGRRNDGGDSPQMGGWGGFVWDTMEPGARAEDDEDEEESPRMQRPGYPWGSDERRGNITSMHDYAQGKEHKQQSKRMIGFQQDEGQKEKGHLTKEEAEEWVDQMRTKDGRPGKRWTYDEIRQYAGNYGVSGEQKVIDFFVVLNMMYSDYCHVAKKLGVDRMDFYAGMAKAFMDDPDAVEGKLKMYREYIAKDQEE